MVTWGGSGKFGPMSVRICALLENNPGGKGLMVNPLSPKVTIWLLGRDQANLDL